LDGDGELSVRELTFIMQGVGINPTEAEVINFIRTIDLDNNGSINFDEFVELMAKNKREAQTEEDFRMAWRMLDADEKGYLTLEELKEAVFKLGELATDREVEEMMHEVDVDGDGKLSFDDFLKTMTQKRN
jgi:calmodulin